MSEGVVLYSNDCGKCLILKNKLDNKSIKYETVNAMEVFKEKGFRSMPHLEIDGKIKDFGEAIRWINAM